MRTKFLHGSHRVLHCEQRNCQHSLQHSPKQRIIVCDSGSNTGALALVILSY